MFCNHTAFCIPLACERTGFVRVFLALVHVILIVERSGNPLPLCDFAAVRSLWFLSLTLCEKNILLLSLRGAFAVLLAAAAFRLPLCRHLFSFSSFKFGGMTDCIGTIRYLIQRTESTSPHRRSFRTTGLSFAKKNLPTTRPPAVSIWINDTQHVLMRRNR
jgi:hypothetical protein